MKPYWLFPIALLLPMMSFAADDSRGRVTTVTIESGSITPLHLRPDFESVIHLPEEVTSVVVGSPGSFHVEHSESEPTFVYVKPAVRVAAQSDLLVVMKSGQHVVLELMSDGEGATASQPVDFVLEYKPRRTFVVFSEPPATGEDPSLTRSTPTSKALPMSPISPVDQELAFQTEINTPAWSRWDGLQIQTSIGDVRQLGNQTLVSYSILNAGKQAIEIVPPQVQMDARVSILESGDSYRPLVELMGGEMVQMSLDSDQTINPWDLLDGEARPSNDQLSFLKNLTRHMLGEHTPPDVDIDLLDSVLLEAITSTYKRCSAKSSNPTPLYSDLAAELAHWQDRDKNQKINEMARLAAMKLRAWVDDGPYARLFDRPTTVRLDGPWLYFNVEKLKNDPRLERAMSLKVAHAATHRGSGRDGRQNITLLDECWAMLESPILASVVVQLFRTARKRHGSVWGISQAPEDFVGTKDKPNPFGAGIVKNASTKIIGKQPGDMSTHRDYMNLNETAINQIKAFAQPKKGHSAEFLIAIGEKAESTHVIRIAPTPVDYWITTTYPRERTYRKWWLSSRNHSSLLGAYEELARRYPRGLADLAPLPEETSGEVLEVMIR